jgi:hypothetical protein
VIVDRRSRASGLMLVVVVGRPSPSSSPWLVVVDMRTNTRALTTLEVGDNARDPSVIGYRLP